MFDISNALLKQTIRINCNYSPNELEPRPGYTFSLLRDTLPQQYTSHRQESVRRYHTGTS
jgi:hypothetical protein